MLLGLGSGAVYAALGLGIVLAYRGSGVISFAHGAMAMLAVYTYAELRSTGDLVVPVPGLPDRIHVAAEVPLVPALFVALGVSALLGFLVHLVFRPLRNAPALAKVVASVGIMLVLQAVVLLRFGTKTRSLAPILPDEGVDVLGVTIPRDRFWLAGLAVLLGIALWALFLHTRFGLATRASAENEKGAILLGLSPDRIAAANWVMASMVAGLVGILVAPVTGVDPLKFTLLVVPALGAALVGRFSSFGWTVAGGLALGAGQSVITKLQTDYSWVPRVGVKEGLPFLVVIAVLFVVGRRLPDRASLATAQLPVAPSPRRLAITASASVATGTAAMLVLRGGYRFGLIVSLVVAVVCLSLVVLTGYVGQISLAQMALAGIAGFALSKLADGAGIPFPFSPSLPSRSPRRSASSSGSRRCASGG
ncbi:MAG: hypothetical protein M5U14_21650 [Acidimicrobiia bacterium]|nr:hypothetical protein [Acidimicrobiia bacterium]